MEENYLQFEPRMHDYGDAYHKPDEEVYSGIDDAVRNIRRKYRTYSEYAKAIQSIELYMDALVDKYGGMKNFKIAMELRTVTEYIPPIPKFRKTAENSLLSKYGVVLSDKVYDVEYEISPEHTRAVECASATWGDGLEVVEDKRTVCPVKIMKVDMAVLDDEQAILQELEYLQRVNSSSYNTSSKKKKKRTKRNLIKEAKRRKKMLDRQSEAPTITDLINAHNDEVLGIDRNPSTGDGAVMYKGVMIPEAELENINLMSTLQDVGLIEKDDFSIVSSKKVRKMVKKKSNFDSKSKKKKKKKKGTVSEEFVDSYIESDDFGTNFKAFEKEMLAFDSKQMQGKLD